MKKICEKKDCTGCSACAMVCPRHCITMSYDKEGFLYPNINEDICIKCQKCVQVCPNNNLIEEYDEATFYQGWVEDEVVLKGSSSGGFFTALSRYVFGKKGIVFGVFKDTKTHKLLFGSAENLPEIEKFRYSKYYQAEVGNVYVEVKSCIENGRLVLFTGTACQIAGLKNYLGNCINRELLITADPLCHGTPSKMAIDAYIKDKEKEYGKHIVGYQFRIKPDDGEWNLGGSTKMKLYFDGGKSRVQVEDGDTYFTAFNANIMLRECCYACKYCGTKRITDFTMADFWGVKNVPEKQLRYGVGLILCNSVLARKILAELEEFMVIEKADKSLAIANNLALVKPNSRPKVRTGIYHLYQTQGFDKTVKQVFCRRYLAIKIKKYIGNQVFDVFFKMYTKIKNLVKRT